MTTTERARRAPRLDPEERRAAIVEAVIPLLMAHGREVTTRQIAEAAGIAEGTVYRAFPAKDTLIQAAVASYFDVRVTAAAVRTIDAALPLERRLADILFHLRSRLRGVIGMMTALGLHEPPPVTGDPHEVDALVAALLESDAERMRVPPERVVDYVRALAFASSIPHLPRATELTHEELAALLVHGVAT